MQHTPMMFRIVLACHGIPADSGPQAALDIAEEFTHRPWHTNVTCTWDAATKRLQLQAENDYDEAGLALIDEFSDAIYACIENPGEGGIRLVSATRLPPTA
jgi:hypothetical protein